MAYILQSLRESPLDYVRIDQIFYRAASIQMNKWTYQNWARLAEILLISFSVVLQMLHTDDPHIDTISEPSSILLMINFALLILQIVAHYRFDYRQSNIRQWILVAQNMDHIQTVRENIYANAGNERKRLQEHRQLQWDFRTTDTPSGEDKDIQAKNLLIILQGKIKQQLEKDHGKCWVLVLRVNDFVEIIGPFLAIALNVTVYTIPNPRPIAQLVLITLYACIQIVRVILRIRIPAQLVIYGIKVWCTTSQEQQIIRYQKVNGQEGRCQLCNHHFRQNHQVYRSKCSKSHLFHRICFQSCMFRDDTRCPCRLPFTRE